MSSAVRLLCMRHGQSTDNVHNISSSRPPGAGLSDLGMRQAREALQSIGDQPVTAIYSSTARRAEETGTVLAESLGTTLIGRRELLEYDVGEFEGSAAPTAMRHSHAMLRRWVVDADLEARLPGGESGREVVDRFSSVIAEIALSHAGETVVVVGHVGTLTIGLLNLCDGLPVSSVWGRPLPHAVPVQVEYDGKAWTCSAWPEASDMAPRSVPAL
ncbi:histidine phosphatase family protein [Nonomuraea sp. SMC257]|uniref:Histidine phosphatase family protein n=1 Tax=Nonomuraea montanisoli TaxID=2741721 RepID=A0A7Y6IAK4_9ACTN|nr:histidine phosphatase family protein [Nonomuraea montanisoli]NUW34536.1 histidine phosphatase family protein [Nonomuraea montanisoli]